MQHPSTVQKGQLAQSVEHAFHERKVSRSSLLLLNLDSCVQDLLCQAWVTRSPVLAMMKTDGYIL